MTWGEPHKKEVSARLLRRTTWGKVIDVAVAVEAVGHKKSFLYSLAQKLFLKRSGSQDSVCHQ